MSDREYLPSGDELRERRTKAGLSQRDVARRLGIPQSKVSNMETGAEAVSGHLQEAYAALLDEVEHG
jgi:transcriptional regulator with XRE-family HTH domain